jgi:3-hydroxybutyryl-CoA dehydrogenase
MGQSNETIVIAGAGLMGTGIAHAFASSGFATVLVDTNPAALARAREEITGILGIGVKLGKLAEADAKAAGERLSVSTDLVASCRGARLFIETVSEQLAVKKAVVAEAQPVLASGAIIASNTSALSVTEIATAVPCPDRVIGMHFFNPVHKMKLVELVMGLDTSEATIARSRDYVQAIGKTSIVVNETPGLTTSRMSAMLGNEAMEPPALRISTPRYA